ELEGTSFDDHVTAAEAAWREAIGGVRVAGGTDEERVVFHTALYNALKFPSRQDDVDGRYRGHDQEIHTADGPHYSDLSLWDTFRTAHPWYALVLPELQTDTVRSMVRMVEDGGSLPKWPLAHGYTGGMVGSPAIQVMAGSWQKGLRDFDVETAYAAALATSQTPQPAAGRGGLDHYLNDGWVALEDSGGSVSDTLEYAWNDHALLLWAKGLGRPEDEIEDLTRQAGSWRNLWNASAGYFTGRQRDGTFVYGGDPFKWEDFFVEGNAYHYLWYVPYDVEGMIGVQHGGDHQAFLDRWTAYWGEVYREPDDFFPDDYYWHGNEPVMHVAFLGSLAGRPDLSADPARWVMSHRYTTGPTGLDGNDDAGTLSAWFLFASIGLFPVAGTPDYAMSSPLWTRVEIDRPDGTLVIRSNATADVRYPVAWSMGGEPIPGGTITHDQLVSGGELVFELSDTRTDWPAP
ncbi:MAG: glycoside hydrolase family 92 protein, partial [Myxococcales bacterium]|nr:glycoside hydrolase family 92 protein [Myxococcales bacterium]